MSRAIFNFHAPPYGTGLDEAPALDETMRPMQGGAVMKPVGSTAVRAAILKYKPMLRCTGTSTRARGSRKLGRTLAMNPGSSYTDGVLQGAILDLNEKKGKVTGTSWSTAESAGRSAATCARRVHSGTRAASG